MSQREQVADSVVTAERDESLLRAAQRLGHWFHQPALLQQAMSHSSLPRGGDPCASERLEFLGDAVLNLAISELLYQRHGTWSEGQLSLARASIVRTASLALKARALGLDAALRLGRGEEKTGGRHKPSILAAAYESAIGAVFVDAGYQQARTVIGEHFAAELDAAVRVDSDPKTHLQEVVQSTHGCAPVYRVLETTGPDHARRFLIAVEIGGQPVAEGRGGSKRAAEQDAAARALQQLQDSEGE
ncbi:MAG TPA: ribonuclease III [Candidatus Kryptonia bacterium]|nr:ribonuclease III [Candidatus Kryptonia bacterium]